jgi:hypothetical protein
MEIAEVISKLTRRTVNHSSEFWFGQAGRMAAICFRSFPFEEILEPFGKRRSADLDFPNRRAAGLTLLAGWCLAKYLTIRI